MKGGHKGGMGNVNINSRHDSRIQQLKVGDILKQGYPRLDRVCLIEGGKPIKHIPRQRRLAKLISAFAALSTQGST